jgi:hypothetical protein
MSEEYYLQSPILTQKVNLPDELKFTIDPTHPMYGNIIRLRSRVKVYRDGVLISILRPLDNQMNLRTQESWVCEGVIAWLKDAIIRPFEFTGTPADLFAKFINEYNAQVNSYQQIALGSVTVTDPNDTIVRSSDSYLSAYDCVQSRCVGSNLGGYLYVTYPNGNPTLNWLASAPDTSTQIIEFGENLTAFTRAVYGGNTYTACIPLGAKDEDGKRLTIASVNDGKDYLINNALAGSYGAIYAPTNETTWDDVTVAANLKQKATEWLTNIGSSVKEKINLGAIDLHNADAEVESFQFLDNILVKSSPHGLSANYVLTELRIPLNIPSATQITLGGERISLISELSQAQATAADRIETIISDYTTSAEAAVIATQQIESSTYIVQTCENIVLTALESYTTTGDLETMLTTIRSEITQLADSVTFQFTQTNQTISETQDGVSQEFSEIYSFIRLIASGIVIGKSTSDVKLKLSNDVLYFFTGDETSVTTENAIAYFSTNRLYVNNSTIRNITLGTESQALDIRILGEGDNVCAFCGGRIN